MSVELKKIVLHPLLYISCGMHLGRRGGVALLLPCSTQLYIGVPARLAPVRGELPLSKVRARLYSRYTAAQVH